MFDHGDTAVLYGKADEPFATTGDDAVDGVVLLEEDFKGGAVGGGDDLHGVGVDAGGFEGRLNNFGQLHVRVEGFFAATEDGGVARFEAKDGAVDGDVGARFVDDADDAHGHADFAQVKAAGWGHPLDFFADGVGQGGDLANAFSHFFDALGGEGKAFGHGAGETVLAGCGEVECVGLEDCIGLSDEIFSQQLEELVLRRGG